MNDELAVPNGAPDARPEAPLDGPRAPGPVRVSRRAALRVLGLATGGVATAGALAGCEGRTPAAAALPDSAAAPAGLTGAGGDDAARTFLTARERETVEVLVDYVIPRDERSGSASDAGVPAWMDAFLAHPDTEADFRAAIRGGLAWLDAESARRFGQRFVQADDAERRRLLDDIAYPARARPAMSHGVAFFTRFRDFTASGFYSSRVGWADLGYRGNVALPAWNGCPEPALARLGVRYDDAGPGSRAAT